MFPQYTCDICNNECGLISKSKGLDVLWKNCLTCGLKYHWRYARINIVIARSLFMNKKLYSVNEIAGMVNRTPTMVRYWIAKGYIPYYHIAGRFVFSESDIESIKWFASNSGQKRGVKSKQQKEVIENGKQSKENGFGITISSDKGNQGVL